MRSSALVSFLAFCALTSALPTNTEESSKLTEDSTRGNAGNQANTGDIAADPLGNTPTEVEIEKFLKENYDWETPKISFKEETKGKVLVYVTATNGYQKFNKAIRGTPPIAMYNSHTEAYLFSIRSKIWKLTTTDGPPLLQTGPTEIATSEFADLIENSRYDSGSDKVKYQMQKEYEKKRQPEKDAETKVELEKANKLKTPKEGLKGSDQVKVGTPWFLAFLVKKQDLEQIFQKNYLPLLKEVFSDIKAPVSYPTSQ